MFNINHLKRKEEGDGVVCPGPWGAPGRPPLLFPEE